MLACSLELRTGGGAMGAVLQQPGAKGIAFAFKADGALPGVCGRKAIKSWES